MNEYTGFSFGAYFMAFLFSIGVMFLFHAGMIATTYGIDMYVADQVRLDGNLSPTAIAGAEAKANGMSMKFKVINNPAPVALNQFVNIHYEIEVPVLSTELGNRFGLITKIQKNKTIMRTGER